jgi:hypothetical protein
MSRTRKIGLTIDDPLAPARPSDVPDRGMLPDTLEPPSSRTQANEKSSGVRTRRRTRQPAASDGAATSAVPVAPGKPTDAQLTARVATPSATPEGAAPAGVWRTWGGLTRVASYRLPDELLAELADTAAELQLPIGLLVTAAIAHLLDEPAVTIEALVDRADDARIQGRRASRRGADRRELEEAAT